LIQKLIKILEQIKHYFKTNILMSTFVITSLINACLVRFLTVNNYFAIKPVLADITVLLTITAIGYFIKPKHQFKYFLGWSILLTLICIVNTVYYGNYLSFASISLLKTATEITGYVDAVFENILQIKDFIFLIPVFALSFVHLQLKRKGYYETVKDENGKLRFLNTIVASLIVLGFFISSLTATDLSRLSKQWNRNSIVMEFGIYIYQFNDVISSVRTSVNEMFGYDEAYKTFREYYEIDQQETENKYTNLFTGKNVLVIHGESIQSFAMNLKFNGEELTPNLNKLIKQGIYFSNFYSQESVGNSSDSEFTSLSSLLPSSSGTVFMNYFDRKYETILTLLKEKNYYTFSMHANNGNAWNRNITYKYLGYDNFYYYTKDFEIDEEIGLGLSDKSFFRQASDIIENIDKEQDNWYGTLVMLTNHTPFSDIVEYSDYSVDYITDEKDPETGENIVIPWLEGTKMGNYLKSVHYADEAIGELITYLEEKGLLDDTIIVLYGDHDCKLKQSEFKKLYESEYYPEVLIDAENTVGVIDDFTYEINRKVPFFIWSKDTVKTKYAKEVDEAMGMIDIMPTLANMLGVKPKYALGNDMFSVEDNVVVFPDGNWLTNKVYYNSSNGEFRQLDLDSSIELEYIENNNKYAEKLIGISNSIITYDLIKAYETGEETYRVEK